MQHGLEKKKTLRDSLLLKRKSEDSVTTEIVKDQVAPASSSKRKKTVSK